MSSIVLVPIGAVDPAVLQWLSVSLRDSLRMRCDLSPTRIDPAEAFHSGRQQYHSTKLLARLAEMPASDNARLLGIASVDLFIPILTFVFGEAQLGNRAALISTHRLQQSFYGLPPDENLFYERVEKEAIHELGHAIGLIHCKRFDCVMHFSNSIEQVDLKSNLFCDACNDILMEKV